MLSYISEQSHQDFEDCALSFELCANDENIQFFLKMI